MPRHKKNGGDFDFAIHEDPPALMDEGSDVRDFADTHSDIAHEPRLEKGDETLLNHDPDDHIPVETTGSNMTKASTLVDGQTEEPKANVDKDVESTIESMLEELQDEKGILQEKDDSEASYSRRESAMTGTQDGETESSFSRRESGLTSETHDWETEGSSSRRESAISYGTYSSRRESGHDDGSYLEHGSEDEPSVVDDEGHTQATDSRRESTLSAATRESHRRASGRTEALIQAAARDIVDQISHGRKRDSWDVGSVVDDQSVVSGSRHTSARSSDGHKSLADESVTHTSPRPSDGHKSLADESVTHTSPRPSDARESLADESIIHTSPRPSDAHKSLADESVTHTSPRPSDTHESLVNESVATPSARLSDTHETLAGESIIHTSPRQSDGHESLADERVTQYSARPSDAHDSLANESIRESVEDEHENIASTEEAADNSSHNEHENDDDVFSDHSPRSSVGSVSEAEQRKMSPNVTQRRTPRISDFSHYDTDDQDDFFVPTVRGTPRPPFRSPSSVKAIQMSSPPPSVLGSSRNSRKTPLPTVSRLGSPSAQYSPKRTPPRFKRNTPPLVLLHATLLPLRWPWGDVLDKCLPDELSEGGKGLLEAWRQLQDVLGDTVCERGILLPHPQNDFEVLEERLLEALELPLRRRARILQCGHYLGPSNDMTLTEETDSEDEFQYEEPRTSRSSFEKKTHWCGTCRSEIKFDSLGIGKVFRVKVYASNGLVKAGAWEACWKEMERVDVELEPLVESDVHEELVRLDAEQQRAVELQHPDDEALELEPEGSYLEHATTEVHHHMPSSPPPEIQVTSSPPPPVDEDRRRRNEERLREIYGHTPPTHPEPSEHPPSSEYVDHRTPPSPSAEAFARREERRHARKSESLSELLLEAVKVMMQDRKNVMIALMSVLVLALALRGGSSPAGQQHLATWQTVVKEHEAPATVTVTQMASSAQETVESLSLTVEAVVSSAAAPSEEAASMQSVDPCLTASPAGEGYQPVHAESETAVSEKIARVVETVTVTAPQTQETQETAVHEEPPEPVEPVAEMIEEDAGDAGEPDVIGADELDVGDAGEPDVSDADELEAGDADEPEVEREL